MEGQGRLGPVLTPFLSCDIKRISQIFKTFKNTD